MKLAKKFNKICVHKFSIGDVEDPSMAAQFEIDRFFKEEKVGKWLDKKEFVITAGYNFDESGLYYKYRINALMEPKDYTYFCLIKEDNGNRI